MGGQREEIFTGSGMGMENEGEGWRGVETNGGEGSKTEQVMKKKGKHKSTTGIGASLTRDYREKEEDNNKNSIVRGNLSLLCPKSKASTLLQVIWRIIFFYI